MFVSDTKFSICSIEHRTAISMGDGTQNQDSTKDQIIENIRLHKELLQTLKLQPWSMRRKLRLVRQVCIVHSHSAITHM